MKPPPDALKKPLKPRRFRLAWRLSSLFVLLYLGVAGLLYGIQDSLVFPGHDTQGREWATVQPLQGTELVHLKTADGVPIVGLFGGATNSHINPLTVLYFYGNGECVSASLKEFQTVRSMGVNTLIVDYTGYGMSGGNPSERGFYQTADAAYNYLIHTRHISPERLIIMGRSIGGAVAVDLASRRPAHGLITFSAFTSLPNVSRSLYPFLPIASLLRYRFDNEAKISRVSCPILLAHGQKDTLVPFFMSEQLAKTAKSHVTRLILPKSGHNDVFDTEKAEVTVGIQDFLHKRE